MTLNLEDQEECLNNACYPCSTAGKTIKICREMELPKVSQTKFTHLTTGK